jgi:Holliday junction resolvase
MSKRKGTRNEHRSIALLEASGYHCTRSAGSLGDWDIVAIGSRRIPFSFSARRTAGRLWWRWKP